MAQSLRHIKSRIKSIENTKKVTSALSMISNAKLSRLNSLFYGFRFYFFKLEGLLDDVMEHSDVVHHPLFSQREVVKNTVLYVITTDNGLCGSYNNNIIKAAQEFINERGRESVKLVVIGKKGLSYFKKRNYKIINSYLELHGRYNPDVFARITDEMLNLYASGQADEIHMAYTYFKTSVTHMPVIKKILNIDITQGVEKESVHDGAGYIIEPDANSVVNELVPKYLFTRVKLTLLGSFMSEHASRLIAMKTATDNAEDLLKQMILTRNKVRQAAITQEMMEVISSAEALKG